MVCARPESSAITIEQIFHSSKLLDIASASLLRWPHGSGGPPVFVLFSSTVFTRAK